MMFAFLAAAALIAAPTPAPAYVPPAPILTMDVRADTPIICAKQFLINRDRLNAGERVAEELVEAYSAAAKLKPEEVMELRHTCNVFAMGAAFGVILTITEAEEIAKTDAPIGGHIIETSGSTP